MWSYQSYGVIRSYPRVDGVIGNTGLYSRVIGVIDAELSELWGYKVIHHGV